MAQAIEKPTSSDILNLSRDAFDLKGNPHFSHLTANRKTGERHSGQIFDMIRALNLTGSSIGDVAFDSPRDRVVIGPGTNGKHRILNEGAQKWLVMHKRRTQRRWCISDPQGSSCYYSFRQR